MTKFRYVFYCPGNHDLWVTSGERHHNSLEKFFGQLLLCDRLGVLTHPVRFADGVTICPLFSWYTVDFVEGAIEPWIRGFDAFCKWPAFLRDDDAPEPRGDDADVLVDGLLCSRFSTEPGVSAFMARLNESAVDAVANRGGGGVVITYSHFLPKAILFEGMGGFKALGHVMGDTRLLDQIKRLKSLVHVFGHSHQNVDAVLDGVRYVQNALGHPEEGHAAVHPAVVWDAGYQP